MTSEIPIDEATGGEVDPEIVEVCQAAEVKSLLALPHAVEEGTLEVAGKSAVPYKFTRPFPQKGSDGGDAVIHFHGVLQLDGKSAPYSITRISHGDWTESFISVNGNKSRVLRDSLPREVTYAGTVEVNVPSSFSYKVTQTIGRGDPALERDEFEALLTAHNNAANTNAVREPGKTAAGALLGSRQQRRLRRLARSRESGADEQFL